MTVMITKDLVIDRLKTVIDPELHINIVDLGLIYGVECSVKNDKWLVKVTMTLTTPGCPLAPVIDKLIRNALGSLGAETIELKLVWEPAWTIKRMSEEGKLKLNMI